MLSNLRKDKIRSINQLNKGQTYIIASPRQEDFLVKITECNANSILTQPLKPNSVEKSFNWNFDFVIGESEIYSVN
jgi:hypothetical protein